jgi:glyoxylase-like metal-dependent hydrolase (beta-lactamase superfamily II)
MVVTNELKEAPRVIAPVTLNTLSVNVFTAPGKTMVGERPKPFGEALGFDPITSTLIFGEYDAVLVDAMGTVAEAEALADWVALHNRNLETIYITHAHFDHFYGLSIVLDRFPSARAIATPKTVNAKATRPKWMCIQRSRAFGGIHCEATGRAFPSATRFSHQVETLRDLRQAHKVRRKYCPPADA